MFYIVALGHYLIYQTHLNLLLSVFTFTLGAYLVARFQRDNFKVSPRAVSVYGCLWHHCFCWACCVTCVYWFGLYNGKPVTLSNVLAHSTNSIVFVVDLFVIKCSVRLRSILFTISYTIIYLAFTVLYGVLGGVDK